MEVQPAMTRPVLVSLLAALALSACGADGPPIPPSEPPQQPSGAITVTGEGRFGVTASNG
jgi:predicted small lipoprotein YifL